MRAWGAVAACAIALGCGQAEEGLDLRQIDEAPVLPPPADALEAEIRQRAPSEAMLMVPAEAVVRGELSEGQRRAFSAVLRAGLCYKVLGQGGPGVQDLDVFAFDPDGVLLQRDAAEGPAPVVGVQRAICPVEPGLYRFEVRMAAGAGLYAAQVWVSQ